MKKLFATIFVISLLMIASTQKSKAQCFTGGGFNEIGVIPGSYGLYDNNLSLPLPPGDYKYTVSYAGYPIISTNYFYMYLPDQTSYWYPNNQLTLGPNNKIIFNIVALSSQTTLCSSEIVTIHLQRKIGMTWWSQCDYTFSVNVTEESRSNLAFTEGYSQLYYRGDDNFMYTESWNGTNWINSLITPTGGWGTVRVGGNISSFTDNSGVFFRSTDNKLYELVNNGSSWTLSLISCCMDPTSNVCAVSNNQVFIYSSTGALYQMVYSNAVWSSNVITPTGGWGGVTINPASITAIKGTGQLFFATTYGTYGPSIYTLTYSHGHWTLTLVGGGSSTPGMTYKSDLISTDNASVYYRGQDKRIHCFTNCSSPWVTCLWAFDAMTNNDPNIIAEGFLTKFPNEDRVFYKCNTGQVVNLYKSGGQWYNYPLDYGFTNTRGDLVAAEGKIFFIGRDKLIHNYMFGTNWFEGPISAPANVFGCSSQYMNGNYRLGADTKDGQESVMPLLELPFDVFPNPNNGTFQVQLSESAENAQVELFNTLGERVDAFQMTGTNYSYTPTKTLAPGIYLLRVNSNGIINSKRIMIE